MERVGSNLYVGFRACELRARPPAGKRSRPAKAGGLPLAESFDTPNSDVIAPHRAQQEKWHTARTSRRLEAIGCYIKMGCWPDRSDQFHFISLLARLKPGDQSFFNPLLHLFELAVSFFKRVPETGRIASLGQYKAPLAQARAARGLNKARRNTAQESFGDIFLPLPLGLSLVSHQDLPPRHANKTAGRNRCTPSP